MPSIDEALLRIFYEYKNQPVSGEDLAQKLNLSRTAIWNHVESLREAGYEIEAKPHIGYQLVSRPDRLIRDEIKARLKTQIMGQNIVSFEELDSTNDTATQLAEDGVQEGTCVIAESQRHGRGRLGRLWHSPKKSGIWCSLILRPKLAPTGASLLTLITALSVVRTIKKVCHLEAKIKWPNDVLLKGKKVCGILSEMSSEPDQIRFVVLGVGINVNQEQNEFPKELQKSATSLLAQSGKRISRIDFLCAFLTELEKLTFSLHQDSKKILNEVKSNCDTLNRHVEIKIGEQLVTGRALDLDFDGALLLRQANGHVEKVYSGDLQLIT